MTLVCGGWIAWLFSRGSRGAGRVLLFIFVWAASTIVLGAAGAAVGFPACMAADRAVR
jgi:hypothetical protein